jgi:hypothetical protein
MICIKKIQKEEEDDEKTISVHVFISCLETLAHWAFQRIRVDLPPPHRPHSLFPLTHLAGAAQEGRERKQKRKEKKAVDVAMCQWSRICARLLL